MSNKLTAKQEAFCREYIIDLNATQAAVRAGYKPDNAYATGAENLRKPQIAAFIDSLKQDRSKRTQIDADWVLKASKQLFDRCMDEDDFSPSGAAKSIEMIGRHVSVKAFDDQKQSNASDNLASSVNKLIDKLPN